MSTCSGATPPLPSVPAVLVLVLLPRAVGDSSPAFEVVDSTQHNTRAISRELSTARARGRRVHF